MDSAKEFVKVTVISCKEYVCSQVVSVDTLITDMEDAFDQTKSRLNVIILCSY